MSTNVEVRRAAEADMLEAFAWYESEQIGSGVRFLAEAERCIEVVAERPTSFKVVKGRTRVAEVHHFPYRLYFIADDNRIMVVACLHASRSSRHVRKRLE